jgi:hypothetical protein
MTNGDIDVIFSIVDDCFNAGKFEIVDNILDMDPSRMSQTMILSILTTTLAAKSELKNRRRFYEECEKCVPINLLGRLS